jgi:uncharacterized membrane protein YccC
MMKFFGHLFSLIQQTSALTSHFSLLCALNPQGEALLHAASLRDFLGMLCTTRQEIASHMEALEVEVGRAIALLEASNPDAGRVETTSFPYQGLCRFLTIFDPYLDKYPDLAAAEAWRLFRDNTLHYYYPLDKGTSQEPA